MQHKTVFITGANRGIGLGLSLKFLSAGHRIIATARNPDGARELWELEHSYKDQCRIVQMDVTNADDIQRVATELNGEPIDLLINNAGFFEDRGGLTSLQRETLAKTLTINAMAPVHVTQALLPNLQRAKDPVHVVISSLLGSIAQNTSGEYYAYRMSKAAVNMFVKTMSVEFPKITSTVLHPGWVQTDMGGQSATTTVDESTSGLFKVITELTTKDSGRFYDFKGLGMAW